MIMVFDVNDLTGMKNYCKKAIVFRGYTLTSLSNIMDMSVANLSATLSDKYEMRGGLYNIFRVLDYKIEIFRDKIIINPSNCIECELGINNCIECEVSKYEE